MTRMLKTSLRLALASTILGGGAVIMAVPAVAQTTTASVSGQVSDASGAPVAGATVVAVNTGTNQTFRATTDANGAYQINGLRPAPYRVTVTGPDGTTFSQDVDAAIGQSASLDVTLGAAAAPTDTADNGKDIIVTGNRLVETKTSEVATNVSRTQIETLPPDRPQLPELRCSRTGREV